MLDARDPNGTRCRHLEAHLRKNLKHKHLILLLNKVDLVRPPGQLHSQPSLPCFNKMEQHEQHNGAWSRLAAIQDGYRMRQPCDWTVLLKRAVSARCKFKLWQPFGMSLVSAAGPLGYSCAFYT